MPENPYLRDDGSDVLSDAWDDGYAAGYAAAKPPGYVVQTQAEVDRLLNEAEALRIERDAAREDLAACRQFAADHVERAARQNIVARVAYAEGKADAVALIRERAANALPEVARFTLDEIEAIVALAAPPSGAEAGEGCRAPHCWSEYGTPCGTCPAGAEAGGDA